MCFHLRVVLTEVNKKPSRSIVALGDTVLISGEGQPTFLTGTIQRKYNEISYSLDVSQLILNQTLFVARGGGRAQGQH
jgi:hypothetical protein